MRSMPFIFGIVLVFGLAACSGQKAGEKSIPGMKAETAKQAIEKEPAAKPPVKETGPEKSGAAAPDKAEDSAEEPLLRRPDDFAEDVPFYSRGIVKSWRQSPGGLSKIYAFETRTDRQELLNFFRDRAEKRGWKKARGVLPGSDALTMKKGNRILAVGIAPEGDHNVCTLTVLLEKES
jgi:hypothetical protein